MNDSDIAQLMKRSADTGHRALFEKYHGYVYTIVFQILSGTGTSGDIDDCVVDVFSDVILNFDTDRGASLQAYIGTAARHKALNMRKSISSRRRHSVPLDELEKEPPSDLSVEEIAEGSQLSALLMDKINELGEPDSTIIIQKYFFDRSSREIAGILGMNAPTVRVRCGRAIKKLRKLLSGLDFDL